MRQNQFLRILPLLMLLFIQCSWEQKTVNKSVARLEELVDSVQNLDFSVDKREWKNIQIAYNEQVQEVEKKKELMDEEVKADYEKTKKDYEALKKKFEQEEARFYHLDLRKNLFGDTIMGKERDFSFMTAENAVSVYERFINTVSANKDKYTREDWDEVKVLFKAMGKRKNEIEKDLSSSENLRITGLKLKFAGIKATNRIGAKEDEIETAAVEQE